MESCGLTHISVHIGELRAKVHFLVMKSLVADCPFGTSLIDHHVKAVLPRLQKIMFSRPCAVATTRYRSFSKPKNLRYP